MTDGACLRLSVLGPFQAELVSPSGSRTTLAATRFRPLVRLLLGILIEEGGAGLSVEVGRVLRILWEETVNGPGSVLYRPVESAAGKQTIETAKSGDEIARERLSRTLNEFRGLLTDSAARPRFIRRTGDLLQLDNTVVDAVRFQQLWRAGSYDEAQALAERGIFLSGTRLRQSNESAQRWLDWTRLSWASRIDGCCLSRERTLVAADDRTGAIAWAEARRRMAYVYGHAELIERANDDLRDYQSDGAHRAPSPSAATRASGNGYLSGFTELLDDWNLPADDTRGAVAVVFGAPLAQAAVPDVLDGLSSRGIEARTQRGGSGRFGHAPTLKAALASATHCIYVAAPDEDPRTGWAAFASATAAARGVRYGVVHPGRRGGDA